MKLEDLRLPPDFTFAPHKIATAKIAAGIIATLSGMERRRNVVQAGGCSGMWPLALSKHFGHVYTFEAEPTNFKCLHANIEGVENISAFDCALSDTRQLVGLSRPKPRAGLWRVDGPGEILAVTLDDFLGDIEVDALGLDVEGSELSVLRGAERMITKHRPLLWLEMTTNVPAVDAWLVEHGYSPLQQHWQRDGFSRFIER